MGEKETPQLDQIMDEIVSSTATWVKDLNYQQLLSFMIWACHDKPDEITPLIIEYILQGRGIHLRDDVLH